MVDEVPILQQPSVDPSLLDTLVGAFNFVLKKWLQQTDDMLPAKIIAYDRATNMATVQPMIKILTTGNELLSRAPLAQVPVFCLGAGGYLVNFPVAAGDTGWIKASDRDISLYLQSAYEESPPNTERLHSFSDAIFFTDVMADYTIAGPDAANLVIQNKAGTVKISVGATFIDILHPTTVTVTTPLTATSGALKVGTGFGCNSKTPQTPYSVGNAATNAGETLTLANNLRLALIANGIAQT